MQASRRLGCVVCALGVLIATVARGDDADTAAARNATVNHMKQIGIAFQNHHSTFKRFPPPAILSDDSKPLLSWRVKILPFLEEADLYNQFHLDEPWDSEHNRPLIEKMPEVYRCGASNVGGEYRTVYVVPRGKSTMFSGPGGTPIRQIIDGTAKTIALLEVDDDQAVIWTKPEDWMLNLANPTAGLGGHFRGIFLAGAADASVYNLSLTIDPKLFRELLSYNGREPAHFPDR